MTVFQKLFADVLPVLQERYLKEDDREQLMRFAEIVDRDVAEQITAFESNIGAAIEKLEAYDFDQAFDTAIKVEREALAETFSAIDQQLSALEQLKTDLPGEIAAGNTTAALAAVSKNVTEAQTALEAAREKVKKLGNAAGQKAGLGLKAAIKTVIPLPF